MPFVIAKTVAPIESEPVVGVQPFLRSPNRLAFMNFAALDFFNFDFVLEVNFYDVRLQLNCLFVVLVLSLPFFDSSAGNIP